jgi:predicted O-methyltransferase YrrM
MKYSVNYSFEHCYCKIIETFSELGYPEKFIGQWTLPQHDAETIMKIIQEEQPNNILEVGTFVGLTTLLVALVSSTGTHIHTIDPNFPLRVEMESMKSKLYDSNTAVRSQELALQAADRLGVGKKITFHAGGFSTDNTFASYNSSPSSRVQIVGPEVCERYGPFEFIFIDGLHYEEDVFSDLVLASKHLAPFGAIAVHDVLGRWGSNVRRGIYRFLEKHDDFIFSHDKYANLFNSIGVLKHYPQYPKNHYIPDDLDLQNGSLVTEKLFSNLAAIVVNMFSPASVIQLNGNIALLEQLKSYGISEVSAIIPFYKKNNHNSIPIKKVNFKERINVEKKYDLCLFFEDIDSLLPESIDNMIQACVDASDTVIFASTPPGEMGLFHRKNRPLAYWIEKFYEKGYIFSDVIRPLLEPHIEPFFAEYKQNSSYLLNLYLVTKEKKVHSEKISKSFLKEVIISKERRIEDLQLQKLYQKCVIQLYSPVAQEYKNISNQYKDILEEIKSLNYFNRMVIRNTVNRIKEIVFKALSPSRK